MGNDVGVYWTNLGYIGELFTASRKETPFLSAIGSLNAGGKVTGSFEFPTSNTYALGAAAQTSITENDLDSAPNFDDKALAQLKNVCEISYHGVKATYAALATDKRISGVATAGEPMTIDDLIAHKIMMELAEIARDTEFSMLQGTYNIATQGSESNQMRGLIEAASDVSNTLAADSGTLSVEMILSILRTMYGNGARFMDVVFIVNAFQLQQITELFGYAPTSRTVGGVAMEQILVDIAGTVGLMLDPHQPADTLTIADLAVCSPVFQQVPGHDPGIFYEELARDSATVKGMLYGHIGLDHGPKFAHGTITGLATS